VKVKIVPLPETTSGFMLALKHFGQRGVGGWEK